MMSTTAMTLERLGVLLDAYGAVPDRWPPGEREAARRLLGQSAAARALLEEAETLDELLDGLPVEPPSPLLAARVLAAAPRPRRPHLVRRVLLAAVPLAAAAAVFLWVTVGSRQASEVATLGSLTVGEYESPTDVLLEPYGVDVYATVPSIGCADSSLGCPKPDTTDGSLSERTMGRFRA
jgi:hypothetical protein